ncbi:MAG TPA: Sua5/YciO/YrdC/YwlC family protein [Gammaproteobacteria bacterium]|jgi:L-threonylcarbamoyladenylate synthase|nr:Sua5/YciO/YrdC/YwlC family protein [Gammaproteobacteria bacterium]
MKPAAWSLRHAVETVSSGGVIAYPTESVYGLGCDPLEQAAVQRIFELKGRDASKGLILIASDIGQLLPFMAKLSDAILQKLEASWPGPVTWVVPAAESLPSWLSGGRDTLAVRVTAHPVASALCRELDMALVSTSANRSGRPPVRTALAVRSLFGDGVDHILPGVVGGLARPTEIREALTGKVLRAG